ncbi:MAG: hypothetical protein A2309_09230, partial [Bacteroidetes bacterium RIFOXYB2_FULL_35_7]
IASCKIFGFNEIGIRLPSAIAALLTALCLLLFSVFYLKNKLLGFISVIILVTSPGYISTHVTRTGDYDALLTFFTTVYGLAFYLFLESEWKKKYIFLLITFAGITFAVMTKGVAGLFFIPVLFLYALFRKKIIITLKSPFFYFGLLFFVFIVVGFYFLREMSNPGFLNAVYENELGGRFLNTVETHSHGFLFYFSNFLDWRFSVWIYLLPLAFVLMFLYYKKHEKYQYQFLLFSFSLVLFFFFLISYSQTKLQWYDAPLYPYLALICAAPVTWMIKLISDSPVFTKPYHKIIISTLFILTIFFYPYKKIMKDISFGDGYYWKHLLYGHFMKKMQHQKSYSVIYNGYNASADFYIRTFNDKGYKIFKKVPATIVRHDTIMVCEENVLQQIKQDYEISILNEWNTCCMIKIDGYKNLNAAPADTALNTTAIPAK